MKSQRKQKIELTRKQKLEILDNLDNGTSQRQIADQYGVDRSCVSRIKSNSAKIRAAQEINENLEMERKRKAGGEDVENALFAWFTELRAKNAPVSGPMLLERACQLSISFDSDFTQTIKSCFRKAGVQRASQIESDEIGEITPTIDESLHVPENFSAEDFESLVDADNQLECYQE